MKKILDLVKKIFIDLAIGGGLFLGYMLLSLYEWGILWHLVLLPVFWVIYNALGRLLNDESLAIGFVIPLIVVFFIQVGMFGSGMDIRALCSVQDSDLGQLAIAQEEYFTHNNSEYATTAKQLSTEGFIKSDGVTITIKANNKAEPKFFIATATAIVIRSKPIIFFEWVLECNGGPSTWDSSKGGLQRKQTMK